MSVRPCICPAGDVADREPPYSDMAAVAFTGAAPAHVEEPAAVGEPAPAASGVATEPARAMEAVATDPARAIEPVATEPAPAANTIATEPAPTASTMTAESAAIPAVSITHRVCFTVAQAPQVAGLQTVHVQDHNEGSMQARLFQADVLSHMTIWG